MTWKGFKKFEKCCKKDLDKKYFLQTPRTEPNTKWLFFKVRKNDTLMLEPGLEKFVDEIHNGIWIDIFPLVSFGNTKRKREIQIKLLTELQYLRFCHVPLAKNKSIKLKIRENILFLKEKIMWKMVEILGVGENNCLLAVGNQFYLHMKERIGINVFSKKLFADKGIYDLRTLK